jgi:predicted negative regulator of RcsB-dependent stress response
MTRTGAGARPDLEERTQSAIEWLRTHARLVGVVVGVILAAAVGIWFYGEWRDRRETNAARALSDAQVAMSQNNAALAQNELRRLTTRYEGTTAARQGQLLMAHLHYRAGRFQEGIDELQRLARRTGDGLRDGAVQALMAAGYEQLGKLNEAAQHYRAAAQVARFPEDRDSYLANAARVLSVAGKNAEAVQIWQELAAREDSPVSAEARVRLGELQAAAARGG